MKKKKVIVPNIVAGGTAVPLGSNYYLMRGRKHEEGGIDVGANPRTGLEVEDGEVMQLKDKEVRVFSTVPFLNGQSPAQKVMGGENPNKVFAQQEAYKDRNNINDDGTRKAEFGVWDKLDDFASDAEIGLGVAGLGLLGATAIAPNPYTLGASYLASLASGGVDIYQGIRSGIKGDWKGVAKNAGDLGLSLIGAKAIKGAKNALALDRTLAATNAPRQMVTKTVGRGRGRHKVTMTKEYNDYMNKSSIGYGSTVGSDLASFIQVPENQPNVLPTVVVTAKKGYGGNHPLNTKYKQKQVIDMKDNDSRKKAKAGLRYILQTNGNSRLGYVPSTGESLSGAKGRIKADYGTGYKVDYGKIKGLTTDTLRYQYVTSNPEYKRQFSEWQSRIDNMSSEELKAERDKLRKLSEPTLDNSIVDGNPNARLIFGKVRTYDNSDQAVYNLYSHKASLNDRLGYLNARINKVPGAKGYTVSASNNNSVSASNNNSVSENNRNLPNFSLTEMSGLPQAPNNNISTEISNIGDKTAAISNPLQQPNFKVKDSTLPTRIEGIDITPKIYSSNAPLPTTTMNVPTFNRPNSNIFIPRIESIASKQNNQSSSTRTKPSILEQTSPILNYDWNNTGFIPYAEKPREETKPASTRVIPTPTTDTRSIAPPVTSKEDEEETKPKNNKFKNFINWAKEHPNTIADASDALFKGGASIASYLINRHMLNNLKYDRQPIVRIAPKLKTNININPQLDKMRESLANYKRNINAGTASNQVAMARMQKADANSLSGYNELYGYKENAETELINKDRLNQQEVANKTIEDYNDYFEKKIAFDNLVREKKAENAVSLVSNIANIPSDIITRGEKRKRDYLDALLIMARNPNVTPEYLESLGIKLPGYKYKTNKED